MEIEAGQRLTRRPFSLSDMLGFYAYLFAVGGGFPDRDLMRGVVRRPGLIEEIMRPAGEPSWEKDGVTEAA